MTLFRKSLIFTVCTVFAVNALAQDVKPVDENLAVEAVELSAQADAYNKYCGKETHLVQGFIERFKKQEMDEVKLAALEQSGKDWLEGSMQALTELKPDCKNTQFLLARLKVMRALKDVSYRLNGIDPATVPDQLENIPNIDILLPKGEGVEEKPAE